MTNEYIDEHFADIVKHGSDIEARFDDSDCTVRWIKEANSEYLGRFQQDQIVIDKDYESAINSILNNDQSPVEILGRFVKQGMEDCKTLKEYSIFVSKVRKCIKEAKERNKEMNDIIDMNDITQKEVISSAISRAIDECISEDILKDFLLENKEEVVEMGVLGYSAERHLQVIQEESYEDGVKAGYDKGYGNGYDKGENALAELYDWLFENNRVSDVQKANKDSKYRKDLFDEYVASKKKN